MDPDASLRPSGCPWLRPASQTELNCLGADAEMTCPASRDLT